MWLCWLNSVIGLCCQCVSWSVSAAGSMCMCLYLPCCGSDVALLRLNCLNAALVLVVRVCQFVLGVCELVSPCGWHTSDVVLICCVLAYPP
ncbi:hypothetical protein COLO4_34285 [Corchorus olitorius]|uniref:Secreted protein n=1 Tax=Corchorus olitorius TaxID=93759 RepID=A0A1R3GM87_9ROSI|nr:hypothetical protein COLO4_34285 [Corchorus olitorius]